MLKKGERRCKKCKKKFVKKNLFDCFCSQECIQKVRDEEHRKMRKKQRSQNFTQMKRTPIKRVGKIGKRNIDANRKLKSIFNQSKIRSCELHFKDCSDNMYLTYAHKHKRDWYKSRGRQRFLHSFKHVLLVCQSCHAKIEDSRELTDQYFEKLR